jgi:hypothetical protein
MIVTSGREQHGRSPLPEQRLCGIFSAVSMSLTTAKLMSRSHLTDEVGHLVQRQIAGGAGKAALDVERFYRGAKLAKRLESIDESGAGGVAEDLSLKGALRGVCTSRTAPWGNAAEGDGGRTT